MSADLNQSGVILAQATAPGASDSQAVLLVPMPTPLVVANHTGTIDPTGQPTATSAANPFVFWVNDGVDGVGAEAGVQDDLEPTATKLNDLQNRVTCTRDLENFARLWINLAGMAPLLNHTAQPITIGLEWLSATGSPAINLYAAAPAAGAGSVTGGADYLTNSSSATIQATGTYSSSLGTASYGTPLGSVTVNTPFYFTASTLAALTASHSNPYLYLLFEGTSRGSGQLVVTFNTGTPGNYTQIGVGPSLYVSLVDIKEMYERWTVGDGPTPGTFAWTGEGGGGLPANTATISTDRLPAGVNTGASWPTPSFNPVQNNYILFVHGWNVQPWVKDAFAETAFKRLYWQGYQGRFGAFQWPTTYHSSDLAAPFDCDLGELTGWQSATPLRNLLGQLSTTYSGQVYVLAHSQGNIVTGEALRLAALSGGPLVGGYVASQAAVHVDCYDPSFGPPPGFFDSWRSPPGHSWLQIYIGDPKTPNMYNNWLAPNSGAAPARTNFYNQNDYALSRGVWETDQAFKPDTWVGPHAPYGYSGDPTVSVAANLFYGSDTARVDRHRIIVSTFPLDMGNTSNATTSNIYEIMAFAAQPHCAALGVSIPDHATTGWNAQALQSIWPPDNLTTAQDYSEHPWHSAEFRFTNADMAGYWHALLGPNGFDLLPP